MYLLRLAFLSWCFPVKRFFFIFIHGFLGLMIGFLIFLEFSIQKILENMQADNVTIVFLAPENIHSTESQMKAIKTAIATESIKEIKFIKPQDFSALLQTSFAEKVADISALLHIHPNEVDALFPRYIQITGNLSSYGLQKLKSLTNVDGVESIQDQNKGFFKAFYAMWFLLHFALICLIIGFCYCLLQFALEHFYIYANSLRLLEAWGASRWVLFVPLTIQSAFVGILSSACAAGIWISLQNWLFHKVAVFSEWMQDFSSFRKDFIFFICVGLFVLHVFTFFICGFLKMRKSTQLI